MIGKNEEEIVEENPGYNHCSMERKQPNPHKSLSVQ